MIPTPAIRQYASLPSTMDEARALAEAGAPEFTVVQAAEQTKGRGRFGNAWTSPPGNLYMTLILRPAMPVRSCAQISFALALALADTIDHADVRLKWPNDIMAGGRKIAGILLEMESGKGQVPDFLLAGMGVNIAAAPEGCARLHDFAPKADILRVRDHLLENIAHWYARWLEGGFADIRAAWLARAQGVGQAVTVRMAERRFEGVFEGLDGDGNMILRDENGNSRIVSSGAVHFNQA